MGVLLFKVLLFDVLLPIVDKVFDGLTIYHFITNGDIWWAVGTIGIVMMPGFLELFAWTYSFCRGETSTKSCSLWIIFFGPVLYPISNIIWHFVKICQGEKAFQRVYSQSMLLNCLQSFSESAYQFMFQVTILMLTWTSIEHNYIQVLSAISSALMMGKTAVEHHFHEMSAKTKIPKLSYMFPGFIMYLIHVACRVFVMAILAAYLKGLSLAILFVIAIPINFCLTRILKTDTVKNFWTSVASVGVPICFVSKDDIPAMPHAGRQFHKFYKWNSVLFAVMSILTLIGLNFLLYFNVFLTYNCSNLPFLSCQDGSVAPKENEPEMCLRLTNCDPGKMHFNFRIYGNVTIFVLSIFDAVLVWMQNAICPSLRGVSDWFMRPM